MVNTISLYILKKNLVYSQPEFLFGPSAGVIVFQVTGIVIGLSPCITIAQRWLKRYFGMDFASTDDPFR